MYQQLAKKLTSLLLNNNVGHEKYRDIYEYGFESCLSIIANIIIVVTVGLILNLQNYLIPYMVMYTIMRINTGGFHCKKHSTCIITYLSMALVSITAFILLQGFLYKSIVAYLALIVSIVLVVLFAPVGSANKKLSDKLMNDLRKRGIIAVLILSILIGSITAVYGYTNITIAGTSALLVQSLTLLPVLNRDTI